MNHTHRAIYPGSFDPITLGHIDIIQRMAPCYNELIVLISHTDEKKSLFALEERKDLIEKTLKHLPNITVDIHRGLTVEYARQKNAQVLIRGLRAVVDFEYEISMANINRKLAPEIETILIFASPQYYFISSRAVKEVAKWRPQHSALKELVPSEVIQPLINKMSNT